MNTINNVPRELTIERDVFGAMHIKLGDFDFIQIQYQYPYTDNASTKALAERIAALLSAPSPAGVDGLEVVGQVVTDPDGSNKRLAYTSTKALHELPVWTKLSVTDDAQAIIDGLRGEVDRYRAVLEGAKYPNLDKLLSFSVEDCRFLGETVASMTIGIQSERDQQAQRIGELEGLLREVRPSWKGEVLASWCADRDAALSSGKEG